MPNYLNSNLLPVENFSLSFITTQNSENASAKPQMALKIPFNICNKYPTLWEAINENLLTINSSYGYIFFSSLNNHRGTLITGYEKIIAALDIIISILRKYLQKNKDPILETTLEKITEYKNTHANSVQAKPAPRLSKSLDKYETIEPFGGKDNHVFYKGKNQKFAIIKGKNSVKIVRNKNGKQYIFKKNNTQRAVSDIEVFNAFCYRVLLNDQHPKVKSVHNADGSRAGTLSEAYEDFISIHSLANLYKHHNQALKIDADFFVQTKLDRIAAADYVYEEMDGHNNNMGVRITNTMNKIDIGQAVKIDDDRSLWSITCKYTNCKPDGSYFGTAGYENVIPKQAFTVTKNDVQHFPNVTDAKPCMWFPKNGKDTMPYYQGFENLHKDQDIKENTYFIFLKRILIPQETYNAFAEENIRSKSIQAECCKAITEKTEQLEAALLLDENFIDYFLRKGNLLEDIVKELEIFNRDYSKDKYKSIRVDLEKVQLRFEEIRCKVLERKTQLSSCSAQAIDTSTVEESQTTTTSPNAFEVSTPEDESPSNTTESSIEIAEFSPSPNPGSNASTTLSMASILLASPVVKTAVGVVLVMASLGLALGALATLSMTGGLSAIAIAPSLAMGYCGLNLLSKSGLFKSPANDKHVTQQAPLVLSNQ